MDHLIKNLEMITREIVDDLDRSTYQQLEDFVQRRSAIIQMLQAIPFNKISGSNYNEQIRNILSYDALIVARMEQLKLEAEQGLTKIFNGRQQKSKYDMNVPYESVFFDKKN